MWGVTGACFAFPSALTRLLGTADEPVLEWVYALHTGAAGGAAMRIAWTVSALGLSFMAVTGMMMSWRRLAYGIVKLRRSTAARI
jgi:uncharacterized iron-regulated membrane protein